MRIKTWHFIVRQHRELIPRSVVGMHSAQDPNMLEQLSKNITRQGITSPTLNYLRVCCLLISQLGNLKSYESSSRVSIDPFTLCFSNGNFFFIFLQLCVILEPMQELMSRHKAYALSPRDCLKTTLFQKWQRMVAPPGEFFFFWKKLIFGRGW